MVARVDERINMEYQPYSLGFSVSHEVLYRKPTLSEWLQHPIRSFYQARRCQFVRGLLADPRLKLDA